MSKGIIYTPRIRKSPFFEETIKDGAPSLIVSSKKGDLRIRGV